MAKLLCSLFPSFFPNIMGGWGGGEGEEAVTFGSPGQYLFQRV